LGGVEVRVRPENFDEADAIRKEIYNRPERQRQAFPNGLQMIVGVGLALVAWQSGASIHPILGYVAGVAVLVGTVIAARK
jgi:hypothetical protein